MLQQVEDKSRFSMEDLAREFLERALARLQHDADYRLLIDVPTLSQVLDVNVTRAYQLAKIPGFPSLQIGRKILIPLIPLLQFLEQEAALPFHEQSMAGVYLKKKAK